MAEKLLPTSRWKVVVAWARVAGETGWQLLLPISRGPQFLSMWAYPRGLCLWASLGYLQTW